MDENVSRPISALQLVLKLKRRIPAPIFTQSPHASDRSNRHQLGNRTGKKNLKTVPTGSNHTRNCDILVTGSFGAVLFPLMICKDDPGSLVAVSLTSFLTKAHITLKLGSSVGVDASNGKLYSWQDFKVSPFPTVFRGSWYKDSREAVQDASREKRIA